MKKILLATLCTMVACGASAASTKTTAAANSETSTYQPYAELRISENFGDFKAANAIGVSDNGVLGASLAVGTKIDNFFRVELEGYYNDSYEYNMNLDFVLPDNLADLEAKTKGFFVNAYVDFPIEKAPKWTPYIGGGIGYSWLRGSLTIKDTYSGLASHDSVKSHDWAWNIGLGISYAIKDNMSLTLGYRHENLGSLKVLDMLPVEYKNDKVSLGFRVNF